MICKSSSMILLKKIEFFQSISIFFQSRIFLIHFDFKRDFLSTLTFLKKEILT